jgi:hypothetical protein
MANLTVGTMDVMVTADIADMQAKMDQAAAAVQANANRMAAAAQQVQQLNKAAEEYAAQANAMRGAGERVSGMLATMQSGLEKVRSSALLPDQFKDLVGGAIQAQGALSATATAAIATGAAVRTGLTLSGVGNAVIAVSTAVSAAIDVWEHWSDIIKATGTALDWIDEKTGLLGRQIAVSNEGIVQAVAAQNAYAEAVQKAAGSEQDFRIGLAQTTRDRLVNSLVAMAEQAKAMERNLSLASDEVAADRRRLASVQERLALFPNSLALQRDQTRLQDTLNEGLERETTLRRGLGALERNQDEVGKLLEPFVVRRANGDLTGGLPEGDKKDGAAGPPGRPAIDEELQDMTRYIQGLARAQDQMAQAADAAMSRLDPAKAAADRYGDTMTALASQLDRTAITQEQLSRYSALAANEYDRAISQINRSTEAAKEESLSLGHGFTSAFDGIISGSRKASDALKGLELALAKTLERAFFTKPLENWLNGQLSGVTPSNLFSSIGGLFSSSPLKSYNPAAADPFSTNFLSDLPAFASGGAINGPAIVGEAGPELFIPSSPGQIIPNHALGGGGGNVTVNIDARGAAPGMEAQIDAVLARRLPGIIGATKASLIGDVNRGGAAALAMGRRSA